MIEVVHVEKRFGKLTALADVSLSISRGQRVALVGSNGSGKTTLLRAMCGLLRVSGTVLIDGVDVQKQPERALASLAYIPQLPPPLDAPVQELVRACCALRGSSQEAVRNLAERMGLSLAAVAKTRVRDLSGGMKQKLLAAIALASDVSLFLCDEPSASLDREARDALFSLLSERSKETTIVLTCHRIEEVRHLVDRVIELKEGRIVRDEPMTAHVADLKLISSLSGEASVRRAL